jgi:hypothetical protein
LTAQGTVTTVPVREKSRLKFLFPGGNVGGAGGISPSPRAAIRRNMTDFNDTHGSKAQPMHACCRLSRD